MNQLSIALISFLISTTAFAKNFVPQSFSANYEETLKSATGKEKKSFGKVDYKYPGHLRFEVTSPIQSLLVINPKTTWLYQPAFAKGEKNQVTIQKSSDLALIKFLDSVKDGIENSKIFTAKYDKNDLILTFNPKTQKDMGIAEVTLHANKDAKTVEDLKGFETLTLKHTNKNKTNIKLIDLKENTPFASSHFEFKPDSNTKVITN